MSETKASEEVLGEFNPSVVHERDPRTGRLLRVNAFTIHAEKGQRYYEWPKGSGNLYFENRRPAGRLVDGRIEPGKEHIAWEPPKTHDQLIADESAKLRQENLILQKELEALKKGDKPEKPAKKSLGEPAKPKAGSVFGSKE